MIEYNITLDIDKMKTTVKSLMARIKKETPKLISRVAEIIKIRIQQNVFRGLGANEKPLQRLTKSWANRKGSTRVLMHTGNLYDSIVKRKQGSSYVVTINNRSKRYGKSRLNTRTIALIHQLGLGRMPVRPFFGFSKRFEKNIDKLIKTWVKEI